VCFEKKDRTLIELLWIMPFYLIIINFITYLAFWIDKKRARQGGWRISEDNLLFLAVLGGSPAAIFARQHLRHKTKKQPFSTFLLWIPGLQIGAVIVLVVWLYKS
jgi:uncharacterized membrane protein YsdA (DUF1294 family)